jgi:predicted RecA/RadA family phage recombinase
MQAELVVPESGVTTPFTPVADCTAGDVVQIPGGLAGVCTAAIAAGELGSVWISGIFRLTKTASIALLTGGDLHFDVSTGKGNYTSDAGTADFQFGTVYADAVGADTYCYGRLNDRSNYKIDLEEGGEWTVGSVAGTTATAPLITGNMIREVIAATNEAQGAAIVSNQSVLISSKPICEIRLTQISASDNTIDMDWGLAEGSHATDFDALGVFAAFHTDGGDANIDTHSDDGGTDRALADSTIDLAQGTYAEYWIDARDDTDVKFYVNAILVDTASTKRILTTALATPAMKIVIETEKTSGTATAELRVSRARVRTQVE